MQKSNFNFDCIVIGGGPGGLMSALYLRRFRRNVAVVHFGKPRAAWIPKTHNLLGFPQGVSGEEILAKLRVHLGQLKTKLIFAEAKVKKAKRGFEVTAGTEILSAPYVILAPGICDRQPDLKNIVELRRRGLLRYCPICDGFEFCDEKLAVFAQDEKGLRSALFLKTYSNDLTVILPPDAQVGRSILKKCERSELKIIRDRIVRAEPMKEAEGLILHLSEQRLQFRAAYVELGSPVNESSFQDLRGLSRTRNGRIYVDANARTSIPQLYAVGDCTAQIAQISVASAQAGIAATAIHRALLRI